MITKRMSKEIERKKKEKGAREKGEVMLAATGRWL
jgi:hypothetical protein